MEEEKGVVVPLQTNKLLLFLVGLYLPAPERVRVTVVCSFWCHVLRENNVWQGDYECVVARLPCLKEYFKKQTIWYTFCKQIWPITRVNRHVGYDFKDVFINIAVITAWHKFHRQTRIENIVRYTHDTFIITYKQYLNVDCNAHYTVVFEPFYVRISPQDSNLLNRIEMGKFLLPYQSVVLIL